MKDVQILLQGKNSKYINVGVQQIRSEEKDVILYKAMNTDITYNDFLTYNNPGFYSDIDTAKIYVNAPLNSSKKQGLYVFDLYPGTFINLIIMNIHNIKVLNNALGNKLVSRFTKLDDNTWNNLYNQLKSWNEVLTRRNNKVPDYIFNNIDTFKQKVSLHYIMYFAFINNYDNQINRVSIGFVDEILVKCICKYLNNEANPETRIDGYSNAESHSIRHGGSFHKEIALCNPYIYLRRRINNINDFAYYYCRTISNQPLKWCYLNSSNNCVFENMGDFNYFSEKYLAYWNIIEDWALENTIDESKSKRHMNKTEVEIQIRKWRSYNIDIQAFNSLYACTICQEKEEAIQYFKVFLSRLFNHISVIPYKLIRNPIEQKGNKIWRSNHGSVHHMRTIAISLENFKIFKLRKPAVYEFFFKETNKRIITCILASVFVSLLRIDEDNSNGTQGLKLTFDDIGLWSKIFPELSKNEGVITFLSNNTHTYSLTQLSSCFMFMSLVKVLLPKDTLFTELLGFSNIYYQHQDTIKLNKYIKHGTTTSDVDITDKILGTITLFHGLTMAPHYLEHCRGPFSEGIYKSFIYKMFLDIGATGEDLLTLVYLTIVNILKSGQFSTWNGLQYPTRHDVRACLINYGRGQNNAEEINSFKRCCELFRGGNIDYYLLSSNFDGLWKLYNMEQNLRECLL